MTKEIVDDDFDFMVEAIQNIREKIKKVPFDKQREFYLPFRDMIIEAHRDACNPEDKFLFPYPNKLKLV